VQAIGATREFPLRGLMPLLGLAVLAGIVGVGMAVFGPTVALAVFGLLFFVLVGARPQYGIALFLSTFLMSYPQALQGSGYLTLNNAMGGFFAVLLTYKVYREGDWWFVRCPEIQLLGFIILIYYLSDRFNGPDPEQVRLLGAGFYSAEGLRAFVNRVAFTIFFINYIRTPGHVRMVYALALALMVYTSFTGIQSVLGGGGLKGYRAYTGAQELVAGQVGVIRAAGNPNRLAMFATLAIAGLWYLRRWLRMPALRLLIVPVIAILALAVFQTASRSGLLGLGVCTAAILLDEGLDIRQLFTIALASLLLVALVVQFVPEKSLERITNIPGTESAARGEGSASLERRQYTLGLGLEMFQQSPFLGVGMGNWAVVRFISDPGRSAGAPHSSYLQALVEGGIFCLIAFLALFWRTWRNLRMAEHYLTDPKFPLADLAWIVKSAKVGLLVLVFFSLVADLWNLVILFLLVGLGIVIRRLVEQAAYEEALAY
jgi:O-antigen ligase